MKAVAADTKQSTPQSIRTVLLVEDNPGDARLLREMFNDQGSHNTELALVQSVTDAETYLKQRSVDIVLLDLGLPDATGLAAVKRVHAVAPHVPLVVLTGLDDESMASRALQEGAQDYLIKSQIDTYGTTRGLLRALRYAIERKAMEDALFAEKERAQVTLNSIGDAVICTDITGKITFINFVAERLTGWSRDEALGRPLVDVFRIVDAVADLRTPGPEIKDAIQNGAERILPHVTLIQIGGKSIPIENGVSPIYDRDKVIAGTVIVFRDVSAAQAMALRISHAAEHDYLTGLPNRMLLNDRIGQAIALAQRHDSHLAVLFLDLDGFKHVNDSLGHSAGDKLLQSIAKKLMGCVRGSDTVSRQGGDEFVVLLSEVERPEDVAISARRMLVAVAEKHSVNLNDLHITTSIGMSIYPDDGADAETLIKNADTAMYQAKENGRQGYQFFKPAMNVRAVERQSIEESLRRALERNEFMLHYQPKVDLTTGLVAGAEALLRWTSLDRGSVSPAQFIPIAEDCGLILAIGEWVLREACRQAQAWIEAGLPSITMAVNVSAIEFRDEAFLERLFAILDETGLAPRFLELELTEGVLMKRVSSTASILQAVRGKGVRVAIDDFGTGYSSLSYLRKFPVDVLKIDQSFVRQITGCDDDTTIVSAIIAMARSLKLRVIAEGVETLEELKFLQDCQCDEAQGFYFSRPITAHEFGNLLKVGISRQKCGSRLNAGLEFGLTAAPGAQLATSVGS